MQVESPFFKPLKLGPFQGCFTKIADFLVTTIHAKHLDLLSAYLYVI